MSSAKKKGNNKTGSHQVPRHSRSAIVLGIVLHILVLLILFLIIGWNRGIKDFLKTLSYPTVRELDLSGIHSSHAVLISAKGGKVIGETESRQPVYPASLTKMMTAILAIEKLDSLDHEITLDADMFTDLYARDATRAGFEPGETVKARDLLYGALLPSGAECCIALARDIAGSEEAFAEKMNDKALRIGMEHTHFCNTTGLDDPEHVSTVYDMAILLKYCIRNKTFREMISSHWHSTPPTNIHPDGITFYSTLFRNLSDPYVTGGHILGGKTGYTNDAGQCLASFAEIAGREYILVTSGAPGDNGEAQHVEDALTIYDRLGTEALEG